MRQPVKKVISVSASIILTVTTIINIPIKVITEHKYIPKCVGEPPIQWTPDLIKVYARGLMAMDYPQWNHNEWVALDKLWTQESHWNHKATNKKSTAYGVAQVLNTKVGTPAPQQVARGLSYIKHRYGKPSVAWAHAQRLGWY
jgi:hypothetical protein